MKFVAAVLAVIAVFVVSAAAMPLHCMFMAPSGEGGQPCHMMGMSSPADGVQVSSAPFDHSCCQVSAAKPESLTVPQSPSGKGVLAPPAANALLAELPTAPVLRQFLVWTAPPPSGPPQAVLCTFVI